MTSSRDALFKAAVASCMLAASGPAMAEAFTILIYETDAELAARDDAARAPAYWGAYAAYGRAMQDAGVLRGGAAFRTGDQSTVVRVSDGKVDRTTGPHPSSPEQLGGYFVIDVPDRAAAIAWAGKAPAATTGAVEVRPAYPAPPMP